LPLCCIFISCLREKRSDLVCSLLCDECKELYLQLVKRYRLCFYQLQMWDLLLFVLASTIRSIGTIMCCFVHNRHHISNYQLTGLKSHSCFATKTLNLHKWQSASERWRAQETILSALSPARQG
jgi:hypothetical protein